MALIRGIDFRITDRHTNAEAAFIKMYGKSTYRIRSEFYVDPEVFLVFLKDQKRI